MRLPPGPGRHRDRLLDAMAFLLVDLHRNGVFWGDCSLANTLFRRDGDRIQAYLVDAETSEVHASCRTASASTTSRSSSRTWRSGWPTSPRCRGPTIRTRRSRPPSTSASATEPIWAELHDEPVLHAGDRQAIRARVRQLNDLGYSVDLDLDPTTRATGCVRLRMSVTTRRFHAREMERRTRIRALEGQARLLLNDLNEYHAWLEWQCGPADRSGRRPPSAGCATSTGRRWPGSPRPSGRGRDLVQAYCDVLEQKWYLSEAAGFDVGLELAIEAYIDLGAPAPETPTGDSEPAVALDLERIGRRIRWFRDVERRPRRRFSTIVSPSEP